MKIVINTLTETVEIEKDSEQRSNLYKVGSTVTPEEVTYAAKIMGVHRKMIGANHGSRKQKIWRRCKICNRPLPKGKHSLCSEECRKESTRRVARKSYRKRHNRKFEQTEQNSFTSL